MSVDEKSQRWENRILVTCLMGKMLGYPISMEGLEGMSLHDNLYSNKDGYYEMIYSLIDRGLINVREVKILECYVELTAEGVRKASMLLTGEDREDLEWQDVYNVMKRYIPSLWKYLIMDKHKREHFFKALLIAYSDSLGSNPREYYRNMIRRACEDLMNSDSHVFYLKLHFTVFHFVDPLFKIGRRLEDRRIIERAIKFMDETDRIYFTLSKMRPVIGMFYPFFIIDQEGGF